MPHQRIRRESGIATDLGRYDVETRNRHRRHHTDTPLLKQNICVSLTCNQIGALGKFVIAIARKRQMSSNYSKCINLTRLNSGHLRSVNMPGIQSRGSLLAIFLYFFRDQDFSSRTDIVPMCIHPRGTTVEMACPCMCDEIDLRIENKHVDSFDFYGWVMSVYEIDGSFTTD